MYASIKLLNKENQARCYMEGLETIMKHVSRGGTLLA